MIIEKERKKKDEQRNPYNMFTKITSTSFFLNGSNAKQHRNFNDKKLFIIIMILELNFAGKTV